jgi:hypothetical protein
VAGRRHNVFWAAVGGTLVVAIGVLAIANTTKFDPQTVKEELERRIAEYKRLPEDDVLRRDAVLHELLANESYKEHAKALYREVERAHPRVHDAAQLEREAQKAVPPFLARCKDLSNVSGDDLRRLYDEARSHLANYGGTRQAAALGETQNRLKDRLEKQDRVGPKQVLELQKACHKACDEGRFAEATELIAAFRKRPGSGDYTAQVRDVEEMVRRKAALKSR